MDVRARHHEAKPRCPYCHDLMAHDERATVCGECGTTHHAACVEELGRCTVLGCAWTPGGAPAPSLTRSPEDYRRAVADRARRFVREHTRSPGVVGPWRAGPRLGGSRPGLFWFLDLLGLASSDEQPDRGAEVLMWLSLLALAAIALAVALAAA